MEMEKNRAKQFLHYQMAVAMGAVPDILAELLDVESLYGTTESFCPFGSRTENQSHERSIRRRSGLHSMGADADRRRKDGQTSKGQETGDESQA